MVMSGAASGSPAVTDHADFDAFVRRTMPGLLARAVLYCGHRQNAEDAVAEAYVAAFRHWSELRTPAAWVDTTMRRRIARDSARWWSRWRRSELDVPVPPRAAVEEETAALAVLRSIGRLPPRQRQVLVLVCLEGLTYQEVAAELGISTGAVGSNLAKARATLATLLGLTGPVSGPGDPLVVAAGRRVAADPLATQLRAAEAWLTQGFAADPAGLDRVRRRVWAEVGPR
jgi:RNA polymerase sigma factor (sigma-70 family)